MFVFITTKRGKHQFSTFSTHQIVLFSFLRIRVSNRTRMSAKCVLIKLTLRFSFCKTKNNK
jgi:hypothetical protein